VSPKLDFVDSSLKRAERFTYLGWELSGQTVTGHWSSDDLAFNESVTFETGGDLESPAAQAVIGLWYLIAGLSYYKTGAAHTIDLGATPVGKAGLDLFRAALIDGLGEYSIRNQLPLHDVEIIGGAPVEVASATVDPLQVVTPFGGGIDSVVTVTHLSSKLSQSLFVMSPASGRFAPLEATAAITGLPILRVSRSLDDKLLGSNPAFINGHVPVTAMVTLLACASALAHGNGGVAMSNEHSSSVPNIRWNGQSINHQWSKSVEAEELLAKAIAERVGDGFALASFLRDRSEIWVAQEMAKQEHYLSVFRSCNRAFAQEESRRAQNWCGECDKCLFINLVLAPFVPRWKLKEIFGSEPLANPALVNRLEVLVGLGAEHKPFECVGDPDESAVALLKVTDDTEWADVEHLSKLASRLKPLQSFESLLAPQGENRVPAHWI
jgi:UDP-N-acetyl-alpha-D-muramoyl-L-alanyl-L-glutamate epimerase